MSPAGHAADEGGPIAIHASAVVIGEAGIIIRGISGAGKSSLALGLITAAERAGQFARLVGDDRIELRRRGGRLVACGHPLVGGMVERRGLGILHMEYETAVVGRLVVDILAPDEAPRYPEEQEDCITLCGVGLPFLSLLKDKAAYESALVVLARLRETAAI
jgi:serine kinase of HPr protein (carbohydrate metabolism regulator)